MRIEDTSCRNTDDSMIPIVKTVGEACVPSSFGCHGPSACSRSPGKSDVNRTRPDIQTKMANWTNELSREPKQNRMRRKTNENFEEKKKKESNFQKECATGPDTKPNYTSRNCTYDSCADIICIISVVADGSLKGFPPYLQTMNKPI